MSPIKTLLVALCCLLATRGAGEPASSVKLTAVNQGQALIEDAATPYRYVRIRLVATAATSITLRHDTCVLNGRKGRRLTDCWIQIVGGGAGLRVESKAPIEMKTLSEATPAKEDAAPVLRHNTSKIEGPDGAITYSLPKDGFVELRLFWPVDNEFQATTFSLGNVGELVLADVAKAP